MKLLVVLLVVLLVAVPVFGQIAIEPGFAYRVFSSKIEDTNFQAQADVQIPVSYLIPVSNNGQHNFKVLGGPGMGVGYTVATFGVGYAYAPVLKNKVIFGVATIFDITWPEADLSSKLTEKGSEEAWLNIGLQFGLDAEVSGLPLSTAIGVSYGLRDAPDQVNLILRIPTRPSSAESRVTRAAPEQ
jgi:hypothetical protein